MSFRSEHHQGQASPTIAYTYDPAGRLIASQHGDRAHRYPMDAAGNRLEAQAGHPAAPNSSNRLSQLDGSRYRHDGAGNLIEREQQNGERLTLGYDGANRLVQLTHTSAYGHTRHAHYRYDALGRRISKSMRHANGTTATTHYGWDGDRLVHEAQDHQRTTVVYEPGSFVPMLRIDETTNGQATTRQIGAYHTDALGTPMQLVTPKGETLWQAQPDDWAAIKHERGTTAQPIRFQGQWHDEESGLYYNRHRYYDPQQGRYISQDPIGLKGGTNLYGYVTNPTGMVDPLGLAGAAACLIPGPMAACLKAANTAGAAIMYVGTLVFGIGINHELGRYDTPIVEPQDGSTELPIIDQGGCRSGQPINEHSSCPSELPIIEQSGRGSEFPIAAPLQGDNTIGGGYQPAGTDMIGGAVYSEESGVGSSEDLDRITLDLNAEAARNAGDVTAPIDFDGHILAGEVKPNGSVVGGHSIANGDVRVIPGTQSLPNSQGVYTAQIEVSDPANPGQFLRKTNNGGMSTMFPDSWTADRIKVEVDAAFKNKVVTGNKWTGVTPSGVVVEGWLNPKTAVYPRY